MNALHPDYQTERRMAAKSAAFTFPYVVGKRILDVGCDMGYWSFLAASRGADDVLGLDRNRDVRGVGHVDLVELNCRRAADEDRRNVRFENINLGKQWREFGKFDVILVMSVYHHIYENCGDHRAIWFWLSRHCKPNATIIWEGPVDDSDPVVRANVSDAHRTHYLIQNVIGAADHLGFEYEKIGPALHEPTREVWRFRYAAEQRSIAGGTMVAGAGGATAAFNYASGRRIDEIEAALGWRPVAGSLNVQLYEPFDWDRGYYRAQILDVAVRGKGFDVEWKPRWARFYPLKVNGVSACAFRFEGETYPAAFLELIAPTRLRDELTEPRVTIAR